MHAKNWFAVTSYAIRNQHTELYWKSTIFDSLLLMDDTSQFILRILLSSFILNTEVAWYPDNFSFNRIHCCFRCCIQVVVANNINWRLRYLVATKFPGILFPWGVSCSPCEFDPLLVDRTERHVSPMGVGRRNSNTVTPVPAGTPAFQPHRRSCHDHDSHSSFIVINSWNSAVLLAWCFIFRPWDMERFLHYRFLRVSCIIFKKNINEYILSILLKCLPIYIRTKIHYCFIYFKSKVR